MLFNGKAQSCTKQCMIITKPYKINCLSFSLALPSALLGFAVNFDKIFKTKKSVAHI
jgi:hypothetical protein